MIKKPRFTLNELARIHTMPIYEYLCILNEQEYASFLMSIEESPRPGRLSQDNVEQRPLLCSLPSSEDQG